MLSICYHLATIDCIWHTCVIACLVWDFARKISDCKNRRKCYHYIMHCCHLWQSQKWLFLFSGNEFPRFWDIQLNNFRMIVVPKLDILVFQKWVSPFLGHPIDVFGPKWIKHGPKLKSIYADVPKSVILILRINVLPKSGHATLCVFFGEYMHVQFADMQYAHKILKIISSPNSAKMLSFVIILLSSRGSDVCRDQLHDII